MLKSLCIVAFFAVFGAVYEAFSHEVYSYFMMYSFMIPLAGCSLLYSILAVRGIILSRTFCDLWEAGIMSLTLGSVFQGVLEIYGTTNRLIWVYPAAGALLMAAAACTLFFRTGYGTHERELK